MDVSERGVHFSSMPYGDISADCGNVDHIIRLGLEPLEIHLATGGGNITGGMGGGTGKLQLHIAGGGADGDIPLETIA